MKKGLYMSSRLIIEEAKKLGYGVDIFDEDNDLYYISNDEFRYLFKTIDCGLNSSLGLRLTNSKKLTYTMLERDFLVPKSIYLEGDLDYNIDHIGLDYPLVVKPDDLARGDGVTVNINNPIDLKKAIDFAFSMSSRVIVQEFFEGFDHRILVIGDKVVAATTRKPPYIIGNGKNTILELINIENTNILRGSGNHTKPLYEIKIDEELIHQINSNGYILDSILRDGVSLYLRKNANLSTGGYSIDILDIIHKDNLELAIKVAKVLNLRVAGVDIVSTDISRPLPETGGAIIEVNASPGLRMHHIPSMGTTRNPALDILNLRFSRN